MGVISIANRIKGGRVILIRIRKARSIRMPTLNSYFLSKFDSFMLRYLKGQKPFAVYHKDLMEYEITPELFKTLGLVNIPIKDETIAKPIFERKNGGKYGYQQDAVEFARKTRDLLINFEQGLGKSLTTMKIIEDQDFRKTLIICGQGNLQEEWIKDAKKHNYVDLLNMRIVGDDTGVSSPKRAKWLLENKEVKGVDLINIEALRNEKIVKAINEIEYDCLVVDEVQSAKGWKAQQTEGLHDIKETEGQMRIALTGTPVLNNPLEYFSLLKFLRVLNKVARTTFENYYGEWTFNFWGHYVCKNFKNMDELAELLSPVIAIVMKNELDLPPKTRRRIDLKWENEEYDYLKKVYAMTTSRLIKEGFKSKPEVRAKMQFLSSIAQPKIDYVLKEGRKRKVLAFSRFTTVLEEYKNQLEKSGLKVLFYHGALSMTERLEVLEQWRTGEYQVLLLSMMASRYGLNLTEATKVILIEPPTSFAILEQVEDRAHRIGQDKPVDSDLLVTSDLDVRALENIETKQEDLDILYDILENN